MANNRIKRLLKDVEGLGFVYDGDASSRRNQIHAFWHPNATPGGEGSRERPLRVPEHMSDNGITDCRKRAQKIAGLSTSGPATPNKEMHRAFRKAERQKAERERRAREQRAREAEREHDRRVAAQKSAEREAEIASLMRPGNGR